MFGNTMLMFANIFIAKMQRRQIRQEAAQALTSRDFVEIISNSHEVTPRTTITDADGSKRQVPWYSLDSNCEQRVVLFGDFLEHKLTSTGAVAPELVTAVKEEFARMDMGAKGYLSVQDLEEAEDLARRYISAC